MAESDADRVWSLMESIHFCMLSTVSGRELRSRPMGAFVRRDVGLIYFLTDQRAHKEEEIERSPQVCLSFADPHGQKYVSVSGRAAISSDRRKIRELWSIPAKLWWDSPDDPNIRLLTVTPDVAEFWDAPGNVVSSLKVAFALATGTHVDAGEHKKVAI